MKVTELKQSEWFSGPSFLKLEKDQWPTERDFDSTPESKTVICATALVQSTEQKYVFNELLSKFSCFNKLERGMGYVLRLRKFFKQQRETPNNEPKTSSFLTAELLNESELTIWRLVQRQQFANDYVSRSG